MRQKELNNIRKKYEKILQKPKNIIETAKNVLNEINNIIKTPGKSFNPKVHNIRKSLQEILQICSYIPIVLSVEDVCFIYMMNVIASTKQIHKQELINEVKKDKLFEELFKDYDDYYKFEGKEIPQDEINNYKKNDYYLKNIPDIKELYNKLDNYFGKIDNSNFGKKETLQLLLFESFKKAT